jgi:ABC-type uncharacterized transport system permease subunit
MAALTADNHSIYCLLTNFIGAAVCIVLPVSALGRLGTLFIVLFWYTASATYLYIYGMTIGKINVLSIYLYITIHSPVLKNHNKLLLLTYSSRHQRSNMKYFTTL